VKKYQFLCYFWISFKLHIKIKFSTFAFINRTKNQKMKLLKLTLLLTILLQGGSALLLAQNVTDSKGLKQGEWRKLNADGKLVYQGSFKDNIPEGTFTYFFEDGKVRSKLTYSENGKSAMGVNFHPNGKKMAEGEYVETKKNGLWKYYNDKEVLSAEEFYQKGVPAGLWKTYYDDGKLLEECPYQNGLKEGICRQYFTDQSLKSEVSFVKGKLDGPAVFYYPNGKPMLAGKSKNDLREGTWTAYKDNGEKENEIVYQAGVVMSEKYYDKAREAELKNDVKAIPE
jgi:antitoxin component YwqK of YwqJK toxin-antitoxin module